MCTKPFHVPAAGDPRVWPWGEQEGVPRGPLTPNVARRVWLSVLFTDFTVVRHSVAWKGKDLSLGAVHRYSLRV